MKNKKLSIIIALVTVFQLVLIIIPPLYESIAFSRCEKYGKEYKIQISSLQIDLFAPEYREDYLYINIREHYEDFSMVEDKLGFMLNDKGFCVYDLYGKNKDKHVDSVKKQFLYGRGYHEDDLIFSEGVSFRSISEYLNKKTGQSDWEEYYSYDFLDSYGIEAYITVKVYDGIMTKEAFYIDGMKLFEFKS